MKQDLYKQIEEKIVEIARAHGALERFLSETFPWTMRLQAPIDCSQSMVVEALLESFPDDQGQEKDQLHSLYHRVFWQVYYYAAAQLPCVASDLSDGGQAPVYPIRAEG